MRVDVVVRLIIPAITGLLASKTGWMYAVMFQRDQPLSPFQRTTSKYFGWFVAGMGYIVLWQFELAAVFRTRSAWQWLLAIWTALVIYVALRALRMSGTKKSETGHPDFWKP